MDYIFIDKTIKVSIYKQIASCITHAIDRRTLKYNDRLPTEKEIQEIFDISTTAVRMAYNKLIDEGKIKRIKGKGTFVTNRSVYHIKFHEIYQYEQAMVNNPDYEVKSLVLDWVDDDIVIHRMLKQPKETKIRYFSRVVSYKNNPIVYQKFYLPEGCFPLLEGGNMFTEPLFDWLRDCKHVVRNLHNTFSPIKASPAEAQALNILPNEAIYWIRSRIVDQEMRNIGYIVNFFPGEFTEFEVSVHAKQ